MVDQKGDLAKASIQFLRDWDATLKNAGYQGVNDDLAEARTGAKSPPRP